RSGGAIRNPYFMLAQDARDGDLFGGVVAISVVRERRVGGIPDDEDLVDAQEDEPREEALHRHGPRRWEEGHQVHHDTGRNQHEGQADVAGSKGEVDPVQADRIDQAQEDQLDPETRSVVSRVRFPVAPGPAGCPGGDVRSHLWLLWPVLVLAWKRAPGPEGLFERVLHVVDHRVPQLTRIALAGGDSDGGRAPELPD